MGTTYVPQYNSRFWDPLSIGVDALAQTDWAKENNFVNPPWILLNKIVDIIQKQQASATVIAPMWKSQLWYHKLVSMSTQQPIQLPNNAKACLYIGQVCPEPLRNRRWKVFAWRICGKTS